VTLQDSVLCAIEVATHAGPVRPWADTHRAIAGDHAADEHDAGSRGPCFSSCLKTRWKSCPQGTTRVPDVLLGETGGFYASRGPATEGLAGELACRHMSPTLIKQLRHLIVDHALSARSGWRLFRAWKKNQQFHFLIYRASGSTVFAASHREFMVAIRPVPASGLQRNMDAPAMPALCARMKRTITMRLSTISKRATLWPPRAAIEEDINRTVRFTSQFAHGSVSAVQHRRFADPQPDGYPRPAYAWYVVGVLVLATVISYTDRQILSLLVDPIPARSVDFGHPGRPADRHGPSLFVYGLAGLPLGWLAGPAPAPELDCRRQFQLWSIGTVCCGLSHNFGQFFAGPRPWWGSVRAVADACLRIHDQ